MQNNANIVKKIYFKYQVIIQYFKMSSFVE